MSSKSNEKASPTSSTANDTKLVTDSDNVIPSVNCNETDGDDGDDLLYADLGALSIRPTHSSAHPSPSTSSLSWHLWHYECRDFPVHNCRYPAQCGYCMEVNNLRTVCPNAKDVQEQWTNYLKRGRAFDDVKCVLKYLKLGTDNGFPSKLAREVFFNHKLGTGFFRAGIAPLAERPENRDGGNFKLLLMTNTGATNDQLVKSFDRLFMHTIQLVSELPGPILKCINGVFYRCKMNPGKWFPKDSRDTYRDHTNLPFMDKLEVWIGDSQQEQLVYRELITKINVHIQNLLIPANACRAFYFKHWEEEEKWKKK